jgi:carboxyl-terminal processing protease
VDGKSTAGLKLEEAVKLTRGKPGSAIVLGVERAGKEPMRIEGVREVIRIQSVRTRQLEGGVLYVRIAQFQEATLELFHKELAAGYAAAGASFRGVVLDLRSNTGGLFHTSIGVAAVFLPETAAVVETKGRAHDSNKRHMARPADYQRGRRDTSIDAKRLAEGLRKAPLVMLVDRGTAAGAEIVAAALQDHGRAPVIGEKTFGAGTVQTIIPLGGSDALRLTTARFYRPAGQPIEERAVTPDVAVAHPERFRDYAAPGDPALPAARKALLK